MSPMDRNDGSRPVPCRVDIRIWTPRKQHGDLPLSAIPSLQTNGTQSGYAAKEYASRDNINLPLIR